MQDLVNIQYCILYHIYLFTNLIIKVSLIIARENSSDTFYCRSLQIYLKFTESCMIYENQPNFEPV